MTEEGEIIFGEPRDTDVADTSVETYKELRENGEIGRQSHKVKKAIEAMKEAAVTINELSMETLAGMEKSSISGRINDLRDAGVVEFAGKRRDKYSGRKCKTWMAIK